MKTPLTPLLLTLAGLLRSRALLNLEIPSRRQQPAMLTARSTLASRSGLGLW